MANVFEPTPEHRDAWREWLEGMPLAAQKIAERFPPWKLYRMKSTGHRVLFQAVSDDGTLRVAVTGKYNKVLHERSVFGVEPDDLEECDLPGPDEEVGAEMTQEEVAENIDELRVRVRPDLWTMGPDGKAVRKH